MSNTCLLLIIETQNIDRKRLRSEQSSCACIIHCTDDDTELVRPKDEESWSTLVRAAAVRKHKPLLDIAETLNEGEIPSICYHRKCRSVFTMKKLLETISKQQGTDDQQPTAAKRTSIRQSPTTSTTYEHVCIFCEKRSILREQEIGNPWYNAQICVQITQLENQPWKRRTVGFLQLRHVKP